MTILGNFVHSLFNPGMHQLDASLSRAVDDFREERSKDLARLIESRSTVSAQLTAAKEDAAAWRTYARKLERVCLAAGLELPAGPDE